MRRITCYIIVMGLLLCCIIPSFGSVASKTEQSLLPDEIGDVFGEPTGLCIQEDGSILVTDLFHNKIWKIVKGKPTEFAGKSSIKDINGADIGGYVDGNVKDARFSAPYDIVPFLKGYAVSDMENHVIRYISEGNVKTLVGCGKEGLKEGIGTQAELNTPKGLAADDAGNLYIADTLNNAVRKLDASGKVTTMAGGKGAGFADGSLDAAKFCEPTGLAWKDGILYVTDSGNHRIRKIQDNKVTTITGNNAQQYEDTQEFAGGYLDGSLAIARFDNPTGIVIDGEDIYVADQGNSAVRKISGNQVSTVLIGKSENLDIYPAEPTGLLISKDRLYVADNFAGMIYSMSLSNTENFRFSDVSAMAWYSSAVEYVTEEGYFSGTTKDRFSPNVGLTRGMFVTVLSRMYQKEKPEEKIEGKATFTDVSKGKYYGKPIAWAADKGIVGGVSKDRFAPNAQITRQEMAVMLYRYAEVMQKDISSGEKGKQSFAAMTDGDVTASWAKKAVIWNLEKGVMQGTGAKLEPKGTATRAQAAQMIMMFYNQVGGIS